MLLGHPWAGLAARPAAPKAPLGVPLVASESLALVCFGLMAAGVEYLLWTPPKRTQAAPTALPSWVRPAPPDRAIGPAVGTHPTRLTGWPGHSCWATLRNCLVGALSRRCTLPQMAGIDQRYERLVESGLALAAELVTSSRPAARRRAGRRVDPRPLRGVGGAGPRRCHHRVHYHWDQRRRAGGDRPHSGRARHPRGPDR